MTDTADRGRRRPEAGAARRGHIHDLHTSDTQASPLRTLRYRSVGVRPVSRPTGEGGGHAPRQIAQEPSRSRALADDPGASAANLWHAAPLASVADELKSGPQPGSALGESFEPLNLTGAHAGEKHCLVCENGLNPVAMIFAREPSDALMALLRRLDAAVAQHRDARLGSFAVFLGDKEGLDQQLVAAAQKSELKKLIVSIDVPEGPSGYNVAREADVTVVLYVDHKVKANHAFKKGELSEKGIDAILADLPRILPEK